jgi:hypothetical protein
MMKPGLLALANYAPLWKVQLHGQRFGKARTAAGQAGRRCVSLELANQLGNLDAPDTLDRMVTGVERFAIE